jgi:hypothetical protein
MTDLLTGWLGLATVILAACCALAADFVRQGVDVASVRVRARLWWTRCLSVAAVVLALAGAAVVVLRFVVLI